MFAINMNTCKRYKQRTPVVHETETTGVGATHEGAW